MEKLLETKNIDIESLSNEYNLLKKDFPGLKNDYRCRFFKIRDFENLNSFLNNFKSSIQEAKSNCIKNHDLVSELIKIAGDQCRLYILDLIVELLTRSKEFIDGIMNQNQKNLDLMMEIRKNCIEISMPNSKLIDLHFPLTSLEYFICCTYKKDKNVELLHNLIKKFDMNTINLNQRFDFSVSFPIWGFSRLNCLKLYDQLGFAVRDGNFKIIEKISCNALISNNQISRKIHVIITSVKNSNEKRKFLHYFQLFYRNLLDELE